MLLLWWRLRVRVLRVGLLLTRWRRRAAAIVAIFLGTRVILTARRTSSTTTAVALLGQQDSANPFVNGLQGGQVGRRNLDGVARHRQHYNVLPWVKFVLVLDHLRSLPIVLNTSALQGKLLHLNRDGTAGLGFNNGNVIFRLYFFKERKQCMSHIFKGTQPHRKDTFNNPHTSVSTTSFLPWIGTYSSSTVAQ